VTGCHAVQPTNHIKKERHEMTNEIETMVESAICNLIDSKKTFSGMTYEQGLRDALEWVADGCEPQDDPTLDYIEE
jgi:hypothetical protein